MNFFQFLEVKFSIYLYRRVFVMHIFVASCMIYCTLLEIMTPWRLLVEISWKKNSASSDHVCKDWINSRRKTTSINQWRDRPIRKGIFRIYPNTKNLDSEQHVFTPTIQTFYPLTRFALNIDPVQLTTIWWVKTYCWLCRSDQTLRSVS